MTLHMASTPASAGAGSRLWPRLAALVVLCLVCFVPGISSLPPTDRDESRYVQATKQMVETGDYVDIRLQEESRYKKPIGIYWLQSAYVTLSGQGEQAPLWVYRLVSVSGGIAAVLFTFWAGLRFFGMQAGVLAAIGLAGIFGLQFEARIAKTDAVLLATAIAAQAALGFVYLAQRGGRATGRWLPWAFWIAQGAGVLVKGPIVPLLSGLTVAFLLIFDRDRAWLRTLKPGRGILITALIALPWLGLISWKAGMEFWQESVGNDLLGKVVEGQESHGFPPGYYFVAFSLFMWPFGLLVIDGTLKGLHRLRSDPRILFLFAWFVPFWLFFELLPTKLPHYVLPAYPALLLLMAWALTDAGARAIALSRWQKAIWWLALAGAVGVTLALAAASLFAIPMVTGGFSVWGIIAAIAALAAGFVATNTRLALPPLTRLAAGAVGAAVSVGILAAVIVPGLTPMWLSPRIAATFEKHRPCGDSVLISAGYHEPSLVFLAGTQTKLVNGRQAARALMRDKSCGIAVVTNEEMERFVSALPQGLGSVAELARLDGVNYSKGDRLELVFFQAK